MLRMKRVDPKLYRNESRPTTSCDDAGRGRGSNNRWKHNWDYFYDVLNLCSFVRLDLTGAEEGGGGRLTGDVVLVHSLVLAQEEESLPIRKYRAAASPSRLRICMTESKVIFQGSSPASPSTYLPPCLIFKRRITAYIS